MRSTIKTVLVVDDSEADQCMARFAFEDFDASISIIKAHDGIEALETLARLDHVVDLILLDINMPGMNGHEFLQEYKAADHQKAPFIVVNSTSIFDEEKQRFEAHPSVHHFVDKPLSETKLEELIQRLLANGGSV